MHAILTFPRLHQASDWKLLDSRFKSFAEEDPPEASALDARPFASNFVPLLERRGTGLFVLVPYRSAQVLGIPRQGSSFSFASRRHGDPGIGVILLAREKLDDGSATLVLDTQGAPGFMIEAGAKPLERLVQREAPDNAPGWNSLFGIDQIADLSMPVHAKDTITIGGLKVGLQCELVYGTSYLLGAVTKDGTFVRVALQCFRIENSDRLLVAWAFLDVQVAQKERSAPLPWWKIRAWRGLINGQV